MDRRGRDALAIDSVGHGHAPGAPREGFDIIPMWIADMNFPTIPTVPAAIIERAKHPVYRVLFPLGCILQRYLPLAGAAPRRDRLNAREHRL